MKYIIYDIENIEPIKQTSTLMQADNEFTKSYISGANLRGAFIANYMVQKGVKDINEGEHKEKLLKGGLKFLNAYPTGPSRNRTLPFPKCYYGEKDEIKRFNITNDLKIIEFGEELDWDKDYDKIKTFEFTDWNLEEETFNPVEVEKVGNLHIRKGHNDDNKLFRYEAIKAGQSFKGIIICENDDYAKECEDILRKGTFYVGGSKGSGYGLCKISKIKIKNENPEISDLEDILAEEETEELIIVAASDIIYRNEAGLYKTFIDEEFLKNKLKVDKVTLKESFIETDYFTGFNNKWGYRLPNVLGIKSGSVFVYEIDGELEEDIIKELCDKGIGERKSEGFGRVILLSNLPFNRIALENKEDKKVKEVNLNEDEQQQMSLIVNRIFREKLNNKLSEKVLELSDKLDGRKNITKNQWGKLYSMMFLLEGLSPEDGLNKIKKYFSNIDDKKLNSELKYSFKKIKVRDVELQKYIVDELDNLKEIDFYSKYLQSIEISKIKNSISEEEIYNYKVQVLKELFRLQLREAIRKGEN